MKSCPTFLFVLLALVVGLEAKDVRSPESPATTTEQTEAPTPQSILAAQVNEIASTPGMSRKEQSRLITKAVRLAVSTAITGINDPAERLKLAMDLASAAARAAPKFGEAVTTAVSGIPSIASIDGALAQIKAAVLTGIQTAEDTGPAVPSPAAPRVPSHPDFGGNTGDTVVSPSH